MKIYLDPHPGNRPDKADGGIRRVIDAQIKYLPEFGVDFTNKIERADLTVGHVDHLPIAQGKPFVSHCHGLMWTDYFTEPYNQEVNSNIARALTQANAITAPSQWVAQAISYGLLRQPRVIYHGVDVDDWTPPTAPDDYVLWNKCRADAISNPQDLDKLARLMRNVQFVSTLGVAQQNVKICGVIPYAKMQSLVNQAGVYLATARETFGIGTLEALASGVPVAGWDYGGQSEIILQGETGYLAPYGDYNALAACVNKCLTERVRLSANARADVIARWQWLDKIEQYANLYKHVLRDWTEPRPKVSVVMPCHNLAHYLPDALNSLTAQTMPDWECIVVDDASTDNSAQVAQAFATLDARIKYVKTPENLKLSRTLNYGHANARGRYAMNLDADNVLPPRALEILSDALDTRRDVHIAYGGLDTISDDGTNRQANAFPGEFSWYGQIAHLNQLHSSAMMRREVVEQSAGYRARQWRAEDAEFWTRVTSFGFRAEYVTTEPTLVYRWRTDSKSMLEARENADKDGDWCEYFPWRTAHDGAEGRLQLKTCATAYANPHLVPFGAQGKRVEKTFWDVWHRQEPLVSVIIPVGPNHLQHINDALDSLVGQTMNEWEAVVVNDTGETWTHIDGAPYARVVSTGGQRGAGAARNTGIDAARGKLVFFLDADDMLEPSALVTMVKRYAQGDAGYIYCDARVPESQNTTKVYAAPEFSQELWLRKGIHSQAVLMAREDARRIRFDEDMFAWEDWDYFVRCCVAGVCGVRVPEALLLYRKHLGQRSASGNERRAELFAELKTRYLDYTTGAKTMGKCCGGNKAAIDAITQSRTFTARVDSLDKPIEPGKVRMKYTGNRAAPITYYANGHPYPAGAMPKWQYVDALIADVDGLKRTGQFIEVPIRPLVAQVEIAQAKPVVEEPAPVVVTPMPAPVTPGEYVSPKQKTRKKAK